MSIRILVLSVLLILSPMLAATAATTDVSNKNTEARPQSGSEVSQYLANLDHTLGMARRGEYGRLNDGSGKRLQAVREHIGGLLNGHASVKELQPGERLALANAEEELDLIINKKNKDRMVCRSIASTGTRFSTNECLTVGDRENRAKSAAEAVEKFQRPECTLGEGSACGN